MPVLIADTDTEWSGLIVEGEELSSAVPSMLVNSFGLLTAWLIGHRRLTIYRSPLVSDSGELYSPVSQQLDQHCHVLIDRTDMNDPEMMWGKGIFERYELLPECSDTAHVCPRAKGR